MFGHSYKNILSPARGNVTDEKPRPISWPRLWIPIAPNGAVQPLEETRLKSVPNKQHELKRYGAAIEIRLDDPRAESFCPRRQPAREIVRRHAKFLEAHSCVFSQLSQYGSVQVNDVARVKFVTIVGTDAVPLS